jgi:ankyrin repeat protein
MSPVLKSHLMASLCKQMLEGHPELIDHLDFLPIVDFESGIQTFNADLHDFLLWKCFETLASASVSWDTYILIYEPPNADLATAFRQLYHELFDFVKERQIFVKVLFLRDATTTYDERRDTWPGPCTNIVLNSDDTRACILRDQSEQLTLSEISRALRDFIMVGGCGSFPQFLTHPLDSPYLVALAETRGFILHLCANHSEEDPVSLILDAIPVVQRPMMAAGIMWLVYATRPLTSTELGAAMIWGVDGDVASTIDPDMATNSFLDMLCGLAWLREGRVCITHPGLSSAIVAKHQDSANAAWYHIPNGHRQIADVCMDIITASNESCSPARSSPSTSPASKPAAHILLSYVIENWYTHAIKAKCPSFYLGFLVSSWAGKLSKHNFDLWFTACLRPAVARSSLKHGQVAPDLNEGLRDPLVLLEFIEQTLGGSQHWLSDRNPCSSMAVVAAQFGDQELAIQLLERYQADGNSTLQRIFEMGTEEVVLRLAALKEGFVIKNLPSLLHCATRTGRVGLLKVLLRTAQASGADGDMVKNALLETFATVGGITPQPTSLLSRILDEVLDESFGDGPKKSMLLQTAVATGHLWLVRCLIERGVDIARPDTSGHSLLVVASERGHFLIVRFLLEQGALCGNISNRPRGLTPLHVACENGYSDIVELLLNFGHPVFDTDLDGRTPLHLALKKERFGAAMMILESISGDLDQNGKVRMEAVSGLDLMSHGGETPLILAVKANHLVLVRIILGCQANIDAKDADGRSAIYHAAGYGYLDVVNELLRHGAQVYASNDDGGRPLDIACERGHDRVLKRVLEMTPPAEYKGSQEHISSAIEKACSWGQTNALKALLPYYVRRRHEGSTDGLLDFLLCVASRHGRIDTVLFLLNQGASQRAHDPGDHGGGTPLHHAASLNLPRLAQLLILRGAPLDARDDEAKTPLIIASAADAFHVAEILVKAGADLSVEDSEGTSALYAAALQGHTRHIRFLLAAGGANLAPPRDYAQSCQTILDFALLYGTGDDFETVSAYFTKTATEGTAAVPMAASPSAVHAFLRDEGSDSRRIEVLLSKHGLNITMDFGDDHGTRLHIAASRGRLDVVGLLLRPRPGGEPADCNILREGLGTPLQVAAGGSTMAQVEIVKLLLQSGADCR